LESKVFENLENAYANFKYVVTISQPNADWHGNTKYIPELLDKDLGVVENAHFFICGSPLMMQNVLKLLKTKRISETQIHLEKFSLPNSK